MDKSILFTPLRLRNITLPGRIVRSATELFCSYHDAHVFPYEYEVYEKLGTQPLGLIISAHTCVSPEGRSNLWQNAIWADEYIEDSEKIAQAAMKNGVPTVMQIGHGGLKAKGNNGGREVYSPDSMTVTQIRTTVEAFGKAALRAKTAGFSGVMLHGAHQYLLSQFFYPEYNHRTDEYGGAAENRFRIITEALLEIKKLCGDDFPVFLKINGDDRDKTEGYHADIVKVLELAYKNGLEAVEISGWQSAKNGIPDAPYFIENIRRLKNETSVPLIEVGGIRSTADMLAAIENGASAVSLSRPLMREPDLPTKIRDGGENVVSLCKGCGFCYKPLDHETKIRCPFADNLKKC